MKEYRQTPSSKEPGLLSRIACSTRIFFSTLFDFSFSRFITVQMFPLLYGLILGAALVEAIYLTIEAFLTSWGRGFFYLFIAAPIGFVTVATITRALMEFYIVVFRIAENMDEIRIITERFSGISQSVESMRDLTRLIPFWKTAGSRQNETPEKPERPPEKNRRKKDVNWPY